MMKNDEIQSVVASLCRGDLVRINNWDGIFKVCGVSEHYVLVYCPENSEYSILHIYPCSYTYNEIPKGSMVCSMDDLIFGYAGGYHFENWDWVFSYLNDLESGRVGTSVRRREKLFYIEQTKVN